MVLFLKEQVVITHVPAGPLASSLLDQLLLRCARFLDIYSFIYQIMIKPDAG